MRNLKKIIGGYYTPTKTGCGRWLEMLVHGCVNLSLSLSRAHALGIHESLENLGISLFALYLTPPSPVRPS